MAPDHDAHPLGLGGLRCLRWVALRPRRRRSQRREHRNAGRRPCSLPGQTAIAVVDVSASISWDTYARIALDARTGYGTSGGRAGLVLFSDTAYQALPPGTPVSELRGFERFFVSGQAAGARGSQPQPPRSPWTETFSAGTRISTGLSLALQTLSSEQHLRTTPSSCSSAIWTTTRATSRA